MVGAALHLLLTAALLGAAGAVLHGRRQGPDLEAPNVTVDLAKNRHAVDASFLEAVNSSLAALNVKKDIADLVMQAAKKGRSFDDVYREALDSGRQAVEEQGPKAADFSAVWPVPGMPMVVTGRSYVFITHHKTGTNLMQQICNLTAMLVTGGRDQCAFCFFVRKPKAPGGRPSCVPDPVPIHGPLRGTFSRFTLVANMNANELGYLHKYGKDIRVIHMIRDPIDTLLSDYAYNVYLGTPEGRQWAWDARAHFPGKDVSTNLRIESGAILPVLKDMVGVDQGVDARTLTLDLDDFEANYNGTALRMFSHLFDNPPAWSLSKLVEAASKHDTNRWSAKQKKMAVTAASTNYVDKDKVRARFTQMAKEKDPKILAVLHQEHLLGYAMGKRRSQQ